jgi:hypothetical protein
VPAGFVEAQTNVIVSVTEAVSQERFHPFTRPALSRHGSLAISTENRKAFIVAYEQAVILRATYLLK